MKTFALVVAFSMLFNGLALAKPDFNKALGLRSCIDCHVSGKFKEPSDKPLYKKAKEMVVAMKKGEGDYAGRASCNDCHQGRQKPAQKNISAALWPRFGF